MSQMVAFEAPAGSIVAMEGRVWHTSGSNITVDEDRPMAFAYYTRSFVRPQWNFSVALQPEVQATLDRAMRYRLGLDVALNVVHLPSSDRTVPPDGDGDQTISLGELLDGCPKNWGRWGPDDEVGALNFLTPSPSLPPPH